jgi:hypothetical protein
MKGDKKPQIAKPIVSLYVLDSSSAMSGNLKIFISLPFKKTQEAMGQRERASQLDRKSSAEISTTTYMGEKMQD